MWRRDGGAVRSGFIWKKSELWKSLVKHKGGLISTYPITHTSHCNPTDHFIKQQLLKWVFNVLKNQASNKVKVKSVRHRIVLVVIDDEVCRKLQCCITVFHRPVSPALIQLFVRQVRELVACLINNVAKWRRVFFILFKHTVSDNSRGLWSTVATNRVWTPQHLCLDINPLSTNLPYKGNDLGYTPPLLDLKLKCVWNLLNPNPPS